MRYIDIYVYTYIQSGIYLYYNYNNEYSYIIRVPQMVPSVKQGIYRIHRNCVKSWVSTRKFSPILPIYIYIKYTYLHIRSQCISGTERE